MLSPQSLPIEVKRVTFMPLFGVRFPQFSRAGSCPVDGVVLGPMVGVVDGLGCTAWASIGLDRVDGRRVRDLEAKAKDEQWKIE